MQRVRIADIQASSLPASVGLCASDVSGICAVVNDAVQRLVYAGGETGWWSTWAKMVFNVPWSNPYITLPREVARLTNIDVCKCPVPLQNEWYEFLQFGNGLQPKGDGCNTARCGSFLEGYDRGVAITAVDLVSGSKKIRVRASDARDATFRTLIQGLDQNSNQIYSTDGTEEVTGVYVNLILPFADTTMEISRLDGIQKDITAGVVRYYSVDVNTGAEVLLLTMQPSETTASYRRLFINGLSSACCSQEGVPASHSQVVGMAKLDFIPCRVATDYVLINNIPAIKEAVQALRLGDMDNPTALVMDNVHWKNAIKLLNQELVHWQGKTNTAFGFFPFGSARLENQAIGYLV